MQMAQMQYGLCQKSHLVQVAFSSSFSIYNITHPE